MHRGKTLLAASLLWAILSPLAAIAQAPPAVPALPDQERRTSYSIVSSTCACAVGFALYGDSTDYGDWLEVWVNSVLQASNTYTITSPTGPLATIPRPITDAVLTFNTAQTGTVQIVGADRPRRLSQFTENRGVAARDLNQALTAIIAIERELWDKTNDVTGRAIIGLPGETLTPLPPAASRANLGLCFDSGGNPTTCASIPSSTFSAGNGISFSGVGPTTIKNNISAGNGIAITGTNPLAIAANLSAGAGIAITGTNPLTITSQGTIYESVVAHGAVGDCATDSTAAFQAAITAAATAGGNGVVYVPPVPSGGCYLVSGINETNVSGVTVEGNGDQSLIKVSSAGDAQGNWWDLSGSNNIQFRDLKIVNDASDVPSILFLWACTGTNCGTSGTLNGLTLSHVNINAKTGNAFLYGYGYGCVGGCASGGSLNISDSTWIETHNASGGYSGNTQNAPLVLDAQNSRGIRSVNVTLTTSAATTWRTVIKNVDFVDFSNGSSRSNNSAASFNNVNQLTMIGGSFQCICAVDLAIWDNSEGLTFIQTAFEQPNGAAAVTNYWVEIGGGANGFINFTTPFWSAPALGFIALGPATSSTVGGVQGLRVTGSDVGLNSASAPFIAEDAGGCNGYTSTGNWILQSTIDFINGANVINTCGSIDAHTILQNPGTTTVVSGGADNSHRF